MSNTLPHALLNGTLVPLDDARISPLDRGFLFGDAVYEVIPCYAGQLFELDAHFDRLERSLRETGIARELDRKRWRRQLEELIERNGGGNLSLYLQISRGAEAGRDHRFPVGATPTSFAMCMRRPAANLQDEKGAAAITRDDIRWLRNDIKATSLLANVMLRQQAHEAGVAETILLRDGKPVEGSASNLFIVLEGKVLTPPLGNEILPGITRQVVLRLLQSLEIPCAETHISLEQLRDAEEVWLVSSVREIMPVTELDGVPVGHNETRGRPGPTWWRLRQAFESYKHERKLPGQS